MTDNDFAVRVRGLVKRYRDKVAVAGVDLDIHHGEVFALLGPNGAGKTTTTEVLEGYRHADEGEVSVLGTDPRDPDEVIASVGLEDKRRTRTRKLSGGQRRRLDVALCVIGNPELLFLDEPTTGFDPEARRRFWTLIKNLRTAGTTILLTTHYLDEAEHLADRVGVIADGRMIEIGAPDTLGGRGARTARVCWTDADGPRELRTDHPTAEIARLMQRFDGEVPELQVRRPSLEDIYLDLIGKAATTRPADELAGATR